jgi:hypothetical protein
MYGTLFDAAPEELSRKQIKNRKDELESHQGNGVSPQEKEESHLKQTKSVYLSILICSH